MSLEINLKQRTLNKKGLSVSYSFHSLSLIQDFNRLHKEHGWNKPLQVNVTHCSGISWKMAIQKTKMWKGNIKINHTERGSGEMGWNSVSQ
jgi:hypothetical protein